MAGLAGRARTVDNETGAISAAAVRREMGLMRLKDKIAIVVGAGQGPGTGMGNGRATVIRFAQEGAKVLCVDRDLRRPRKPSRWRRRKPMRGECAAFEADVTREASMKAMIDALQGASGAASTSCTTMSASRSRAATRSPTEITEDAFDRIMTVNLRGMVMAVKHVLPVMRAQQSGVILGISSLAAWEKYPYVAYKASKSAMVAYCQQIAIQNAEYGIRCNVILPGLMDTPMAVDTRARHSGKPPRRSRGDARRARAAAQEDGHRLGRGERRAVPRLRRGELHHRRAAAGRRRLAGGYRALRRP